VAYKKKKIDTEQYGWRQNLEISKIPKKVGERTNDIAIEVAKLAGVDISNDQISTSHRLADSPRQTKQSHK